MYFDVNVRSPCIVVPEYGAMERYSVSIQGCEIQCSLLVDYDKSCLLIGGVTRCSWAINHQQRKKSIFNFKTKAENSLFTEVSVRLFKTIFCPTSWFMLKQLDNFPSLPMSDSPVHCASLSICSQTTRAQCLIVKGELQSKYKYRSCLVFLGFIICCTYCNSVSIVFCILYEFPE